MQEQKTKQHVITSQDQAQNTKPIAIIAGNMRNPNAVCALQTYCIT
jgi:hypothetical protein